LISVKKKSKKKKVWNPKSNQITSPTLPLVLNIHFILELHLEKKSNTPTFSVQNEKRYYFFFSFFLSKAYLSVCEGGTNT
jgi:hypothetical protein